MAETGIRDIHEAARACETSRAISSIRHLSSLISSSHGADVKLIQDQLDEIGTQLDLAREHLAMLVEGQETLDNRGRL